MADSFLRAVWEACYRAAEEGGAEFPAACADAAVSWLRNDYPRGAGREPGWRGRVFLPTDKSALKERQKQMLRLDEFGYKDEEIAAAVCMEVGAVKKFLYRHRKKRREVDMLG